MLDRCYSSLTRVNTTLLIKPSYPAETAAWPETLLEAGSCLVEDFNANLLRLTLIILVIRNKRAEKAAKKGSSVAN